MRYDATEFLKRRWRQNYEQPRGTIARDFAASVTGDPRPLGQSPRGKSPPTDLGRPPEFASAAARLSREARHGH